MSIIEHGNWARYTPAEPYWRFGETSVEGVVMLYAKRQSDSKDWYTYCYDEAPFAANSVKITVYQQAGLGLIVGAATRDATAIWPAGALLLEETVYAGSDPQADFGNKVYDPVTKTFSDLVIPPVEDPLVEIRRRLDALESRGP